MFANIALGRGSFRYVQTEQYNLLKMFTFIHASTVLIWPRRLQFRVTPKRVGATPYALERQQLVPHTLLLAFIGASVVLGLVNLRWRLTARYADPGVVIVPLLWALASASLLAFTIYQVLRRLHSREGYRFVANV